MNVWNLEPILRTFPWNKNSNFLLFFKLSWFSNEIVSEGNKVFTSTPTERRQQTRWKSNYVSPPLSVFLSVFWLCFQQPKWFATRWLIFKLYWLLIKAWGKIILTQTRLKGTSQNQSPNFKITLTYHRVSLKKICDFYWWKLSRFFSPQSRLQQVSTKLLFKRRPEKPDQLGKI